MTQNDYEAGMRDGRSKAREEMLTGARRKKWLATRNRIDSEEIAVKQLAEKLPRP